MLPNLEIEKLHDQHFEDEESLSFSDLPITKIIGSNGENEEKEDQNGTKGDDFDFDFDFGSLIGSVNALESEMCSADEVFSGGQILPFRHSVSSEAGLWRNRNSTGRSVSRSESMERVGFYSRNNSSRSSSIRSQYSTTSSTSTSSNYSLKTYPVPKIRGRNNFHSHPSPKPHVWATGASGSTTNWSNPTSKKSTMWEVLRLGLVRTPEIELQDLKQRHRISTSNKTTTFQIPRNNSYGSNTSSNDNKSINNGGKISDFLVELHKKKKNGGFFKSCKCSVLAIEPIPTTEFVNYLDGPKNSKSSTKYHVMNEDKEIAQKKVTIQEQKKQEIRQGKKVMSHHHRTFEWLKDLSHANVLNS